MKHLTSILIVAAIPTLSLPGYADDLATSAGRHRAVSTFVESYCIDCHSTDDPESGLVLEGLDVAAVAASLPSSRADSDVWDKVVKRLRARQMPPADYSKPDEADYDKVLSTIESVLDDAVARHPTPGRTDSIRRLNRAEYRAAIRDLLALDVDVESLLPPDQSGHGFDNVTVGDLPPVLLNRYLSAAEKISRLAVGGTGLSPGGTTIRLPADRSQESHVDGLPLGTRGGTLIQHHFPVTGEYEIQLRLTRDRDENVEGLREPHDIDFLIDRDLQHRFTVKPPEGKGYGKDDTLVEAHLKKRFRVTAGPHQIGVTFPQKFASLSEIKRQPFDASFNRHRHPRQTPALFEVSIVGPFESEGRGETPSRQRLFSCRPQTDAEPDACARKILAPLIRLAYRRPVTEDDMLVPMRFFRQRNDTDGFEAGIEAALTAILVNPHFLLRAESDPSGIEAGEVYRISDLTLASRLSFFLWSSLPDQALLDLAEAGTLHQDEVLVSQVQRMLKDERSQSLVENFAAQWLYLRNLDSVRPDMRKFPDFDDNLRTAMRRETELLFESLIRDDRSVLELIRTDTTFLNERLARHYGIPGVIGSHFRPVTVTDAQHRGGILRHASILAVTSYATRTSPTLRGNWILKNILGTPPPPPPPNVPSLQDKAAAERLTVRERLTLHRENPACAACHNLMDPVGFALENYDAVGRWRIFEDGQGVDASGAMPDGTSVADVSELEAGILSRPDVFISALTEKLLTFALGRGVESSDGPAVRQIVRRAAEDEYRFSSLLTGIVLSPPFQLRISE
ncbi:DUF1592 domain-containing protein [Novipirellula artificiosorum]|nr:DUF1592 domain-containing protein [Novipirellula artificiosorum]